jgi:signal transduction histidine kinase
MTYLWPALMIAFSFAALLLVYWALRGQSSALSAPTDLERYAQPVDLLAFQALLDPRNVDFLREHLAPAEVRAFERRQRRVAAGYVRRVAQNAALLTRLAELARASHETKTACAGVELANAALQLRLLALLAYARLQLEMIHPAAPEHIRRVAGMYESLADRASDVAALLEPASGLRCARSLCTR